MMFSAFSDQYRPLLEGYITESLSFPVSDPRLVLQEAVLYSTLAPGKRVRPLLAMAVFQLFDADMAKILPLAASFEMIHAYSLIHDDLPAMDNDDFRRGQPTCHKRFGEDVAILAGDMLNTYSFELLARELPRFYPSEQVLYTIQEFARALGIMGMAGGQILDLKSPEQQQHVDYLGSIHRLKTGMLLKACIELPAYLGLGGAEPEARGHLGQFGEHLGLLFQIVDDILDVVGDPEKLGKTPRKDIDQDKMTYVSLWGLDHSRRLAQSEAEAALSCLVAIRPRVSLVLEDLVKYLTERTT